MHGYCVLGHSMGVPYVCMVPRVAHDNLHKTCMFHATRKSSPCKHVMGLFVLPRMSTCVKMLNLYKIKLNLIDCHVVRKSLD